MGVATSSDGWRHWELLCQRIVNRRCHGNLAVGGLGGEVSDSSERDVGKKNREDGLELERL